MQKTGFPGGDTVMNKEEIIRREGEDKRKPPWAERRDNSQDWKGSQQAQAVLMKKRKTHA